MYKPYNQNQYFIVNGLRIYGLSLKGFFSPACFFIKKTVPLPPNYFTMEIVKLIKSGIRNPGRNILVIAILVCASVFTISHAQTITGGTLSIGADAVVTSNNDMVIQTGGTLNVQGTLILKQNLTNGNSTPNSLGTGLIELSGTTTQTVSGQNIFQNLRINNAAGITVTGNTRVNGAFNLKNGIVSIASSNLLLGPAATDSGGSAAAMVVVTGTGEFRKEFSAPGSFTFLVGDTTGTAGYSPVAVNFTGGTFGTDNYLGVSLKNLPDPDPNIASGNYLNRYWTLSSYAITGAVSCGLTFNFLNDDVHGTKENLFCVKTSPALETYNAASGNQLTATVTGFSRFTGADGALQAGLKAYLQGPYDNVTGHNMSNTLATTLPLGDRSVLTNFPSNQPYNGTPWNYAGTENITGPLPANVVDWVLVELRQGTSADNATNATVFARRAGFLKQDGSIVDLDGVSPLKFYHASLTQNLYPVIRHRNHMAIKASTAVIKDGTGTYGYDYSTGSGKVWGDIAGTKQIDTSPVRWGMFAADANADNNIFTNDYNDYYVPNFFQSNQYLPADFNLDNKVYTNDYNDYYVPNFFMSNPLP